MDADTKHKKERHLTLELSETLTLKDGPNANSVDSEGKCMYGFRINQRGSTRQKVRLAYNSRGIKVDKRFVVGSTGAPIQIVQEIGSGNLLHIHCKYCNSEWETISKTPLSLDFKLQKTETDSTTVECRKCENSVVV